MSIIQHRRLKYIWFLKLLVGLLLLYFLYRNIYQKHRLVEVFSSASLKYLLLGFLFLFANFFVQFIKWRYVLRTHDRHIPNSLVIKSLLFGVTLGFITPGNLGELARALYFKNYNRLVITGLNVVDKISGILIFITVGLFSLNYLFISHFNWESWVGVSLTMFNFLVLLILWVLALNPQWLSKLFEKLNWGTDKFQWLKNLFLGVQHLRKRDSLIILTLSVIWLIVIIIQYHVIILAFEKVNFTQSFLAVSAALFTKVVLPISIGDLGIREGATVYYYSLFAVSHTAAFNTALLIFIINFFIPAIIGSYFVFSLTWENSKNQTAKGLS